jgi:transcriptional repressor NrdR
LTRRRRHCLECNERFTTYENIDPGHIIVQKKDGKLEPYERDKIRRGLLTAGHKRPVVLKQINAVLDTTEKSLREYENDTVPTSYIGEIVLKQLKDIDAIAYVRFASVYQQFSDVNEFVNSTNQPYDATQVGKK